MFSRLLAAEIGHLIGEARTVARALHHRRINSGHFLMAMTRIADSSVSSALAAQQFSAEAGRRLLCEFTSELDAGEDAPPPESDFLTVVTPETFVVWRASGREALRRHHPQIGTAHVLWGILAAEGSLAARMLAAMDTDLAELAQSITVPSPVQAPPVESLVEYLTEPAVAALQVARHEATHLGHPAIGPEHLLLGLVPQGPARERARVKVINLVGAKQCSTPATGFDARAARAIAFAALEAIVGDSFEITPECMWRGLIHETGAYARSGTLLIPQWADRILDALPASVHGGARDGDTSSQGWDVLDRWVQSDMHQERSSRYADQYTRTAKFAQDALHGQAQGAAAEAIRALMAAGLVRYRADLHAQQRPVEQTALRVGTLTAVCWPIVCAETLPQGWIDAVAQIADLDLAEVLVDARVHGYCHRDLYGRLADPGYADSFVRVLEDLNDPRRGAYYVSGLRDENDRPQIRRFAKLRGPLFYWLFFGVSVFGGKAVDGIIGNRADALVIDGWDWAQRHLFGKNSAPPSSDSLAPLWNQNTAADRTRPAGPASPPGALSVNDILTAGPPRSSTSTTAMPLEVLTHNRSHAHTGTGHGHHIAEDVMNNVPPLPFFGR